MMRLREEFERAAVGTPGLYHDLILTPKVMPVTTGAWHRYIEKSRDAGSWEQWDIFPDRRMCSRFYGNGSTLDSFVRLASTGHGLLLEFGRLKALKKQCPPGFKVHLSKDLGA
jgi:hypothetical protein